MQETRLLLIRADASSAIGTGHVMRMLALAQAWRRHGGIVQFYCCECPDGLSDRMSDEKFDFHRIDAVPGSAQDRQKFSKICRQMKNAFVGLDGYHFDVDYQTEVKACVRKLMVVDDYGHLDRYDCDILLNQNPGSDTLGLENKAPGAKLLLGLKYALLRKEFLKADPNPKTTTKGPINLLITMGGSDPDNITNLVLNSLKPHAEQIAQAQVLVGAANPHLAELERTLPSLPYKAKILVNSTEMAAHFSWADAAITAGGSTCWEVAFMQVPMAVVVVAKNQQRIAEHLDREGLAVNLGWHNDLVNPNVIDRLKSFLSDTEKRIQIAEKAKQVVDGKGSTRVCVALLTSKFLLRRATIEDSRTIWNLANDPAVRAASFLSEPIPWDSHCIWFKNKLNDPTYHILLAIEEPSEMIGVIRFECVNPDTARISVAVAPKRRGCGIGTSLITEGVNWLFRETQVARVEAYIRPANAASISAFEKAGFHYECETLAHEQQALKYLFIKETKPA